VLELVLTGAALQIGKSTDAECALILWYGRGQNERHVIASEFSFRHRDKDGSYGGDKVQRAYDVFKTLQSKLPEWVDAAATTKTALVYGRTALLT